MNKFNTLYGKFLMGLLLVSGLSDVLPIEFVISVLLFTAVTYGGVTVIRLATAYDSKTKRMKKT